MFENPRRGREARNFTTSVPKILVLKSSSEQIFSRKLRLGAPDVLSLLLTCSNRNDVMKFHSVFSFNVTGSFADDITRVVSSVRYCLHGYLLESP